MKFSCYFVFNHSVLLCLNLYLSNLQNSLRICCTLVLILSSALYIARCTTRNCPELSWTITYIAAERTYITGNTYHVIAIQPVYWRVPRIYRKHSFLCGYMLDRVYRAVA
jgi:hypothetical protein